MCKKSGRSAWQCREEAGPQVFLVQLDPSYCSCDGFVASLQNDTAPMCFHVLGVILADALGTFQTEQVNDAEFPFKINVKGHV